MHTSSKFVNHGLLICLGVVFVMSQIREELQKKLSKNAQPKVLYHFQNSSIWQFILNTSITMPLFSWTVEKLRTFEGKDRTSTITTYLPVKWVYLVTECSSPRIQKVTLFQGSDSGSDPHLYLYFSFTFTLKTQYY